MITLTDPEIRVLAALIEKEAAVPESYPLTLLALRTACNQSTNRRPVVNYDERTIEAALMSLKTAGLVRFVHPSHGGRTTRYRQSASERWELSPGELLVLSALALRGAQTVADIQSRVARFIPPGEDAGVDDLLQSLAVRNPEPLVARLDRRPGERDDRWVPTLGSPSRVDEDERRAGDVTADDARRGSREPEAGDAESDRGRSSHDELVARVDQLSASLAEVGARLERLEQELGVSAAT